MGARRKNLKMTRLKPNAKPFIVHGIKDWLLCIFVGE
jgi:hypothetical protein